VKKIAKQLIGTISILGILTGLILASSLDVSVLNPEESEPWALFGEDPSHNIIISWKSAEMQYPAVKYGISPSNLSKTVFNFTQSTIHHLLLPSLLPNTKYFYQVGSNNGNPTFQGDSSSKMYEFYTAPIDINTTVKFMAISDSQQIAGNGYTKRIADKLGSVASQNRLVMNVGDMVEDGSIESDWNDFFETSAGYLGKTIFVPVAGNHDSNLGQASPTPKPTILENYFPISDSKNHFYYSFNYSMIHFTIADFTWPEDSQVGPEQLEWLDQDLTNAQSMPYSIVAFHCPIKDSAFFGNNYYMQNRVRPILDKHNVTLILNGHDHHYERVEEYGLTYMILGGGGTVQDPFVVPIPESKVIEFGPTYASFTANSTYLNVQVNTLEDNLVDQFNLAPRIHNQGGSE
jgi:Calcineurin-like phosphoesterase/Purple acid Phosphatase, N-terminal domain